MKITITIQDINKISNPRKYIMMKYFIEHKKVYAYELHKAMNGLSYKNTHKQLQELVKYGFIDILGYTESKTDRLVKMYQLNSKGKLVFESVEKLVRSG